MTIENIFVFSTAVISYVFGLLAKKFNWVESKYLPIQNFAIGLVSALLYYLIIDNSDISNAVVMAFSGLIAGGFYDLTKTKKEENQNGKISE